MVVSPGCVACGGSSSRVPKRVSVTQTLYRLRSRAFLRSHRRREEGTGSLVPQRYPTCSKECTRTLVRPDPFLVYVQHAPRYKRARAASPNELSSGSHNHVSSLYPAREKERTQRAALTHRMAFAANNYVGRFFTIRLTSLVLCWMFHADDRLLAEFSCALAELVAQLRISMARGREGQKTIRYIPRSRRGVVATSIEKRPMQ